MAHEAGLHAPHGERQKHEGEAGKLTKLDADIEAQDVGDKPLRHQIELLYLRRKTEAVE